jgi:predicted transcriptional regulator
MQSPETSRIMADRHSARILLATMRNPRSAFDISENLGIPIAVCFRKIKLLEDAGLIICAERRFTKSGKRISLFKSTLRNGPIVFESSKVQAKIEMFDGSTQEVGYEIEVPIFRHETANTV